jgi:cell division protein DivIC
MLFLLLFIKMKLLNYIPSWIFNKYLIAVTLFLVWMFFFDPKDIPSDLNRRDKYRELQRNEAHLNQLIAQTQDELAQLKTNAQTIEKYAREKYQMKKDNEDLFIVTSPSLTNK